MPPWGGTPFQAPGSAFRGRRDGESDRRKGKRMRDMPLLAIEEVPTDSLVPYANNAKIHTNEQIDQICASIGEFGFNGPVAVWDGPEGTEIVEGHGRVMAAKKLGLETLPVICLDHLTDAQRRAYTHVHNQLTMNTGWDFDKLEIDLEGLDFDFGDFGFEESSSFDAIEDLMNEDFVSLKDKADAEFFNLTFTFPAEARDSVNAYIAGVGKDGIVQGIVKAAGEWE